MAAPRNTNTRRNSNPHKPSWSAWLVRNTVFIGTAVGAYYYYKHYLHPSSSSPPKSPSSTPPLIPSYIPTPLGNDFTDNGDIPITSSSTKNGENDSSYISSLLEQRRFASVLRNPHLLHSNVEHYFHLGLDSSSDVLSRFSRVKWAIIVRSKSDVILVTKRLLSEFPHFREEKDNGELPQPLGSTDRFYLIALGSVVVVSSGIGASSISILLEELTKLLVDAGAFAPNEENNRSALSHETSYVEYLLLAAAPGIRTSPSAKTFRRRRSLDLVSAQIATELISPDKVDRAKARKLARPSQFTSGEVPVIIPTVCVDETLSSSRRFSVCGKEIERVTKLDRNLIGDIKLRCSFLKGLRPRTGKGLSVRYLNEALSFRSVSVSEEMGVKTQFIERCLENGVKYVDLESGYFAAFCKALNVSGCVIVGVEYDIVDMSGDKMRVSRERALQATLDVCCQYLWDRLSQEAVSRDRDAQRGRMRRRKSQMDVPDVDVEDLDMDEVAGIDPMQRAQSMSSLPIRRKEVEVEAQSENEGSSEVKPPVVKVNDAQ